MTGLKWTRRTTRKIAKELQCAGIAVSKNTVGRLLKEMDFSLRVNHQKRSSGSSPERNEQFVYISRLRELFGRNRYPVISVDSKKKELVGQFKNPGTTWSREPTVVNDHDFPSQAVGKAIGYGIYDTQANRGFVCVGTSYETAEFAVDSVERWWQVEGRARYSDAMHLLILADGGGGNGSRSRVWKARLQEQLCDRHGLSVTVCHYPPGASKWNPIEHRLFSEITKNWRGKPLDSYETILNYIRTTKTSTGLRVTAELVEKQYERGVKIPDKQMKGLSVSRHETLPAWNYTITPRRHASQHPLATSVGCRH